MCWFSGPKMRPEVLNTRSQLAEVAGIPRYCLAIRERFGSSASCLGHHLRMSSSMWASGNFKYISTSDFNVCASCASGSADRSPSQVAVTFPMNEVKEPRLEQNRFAAGAKIGWAGGSGIAGAAGAGDQCAMYSDSTSCKRNSASAQEVPLRQTHLQSTAEHRTSYCLSFGSCQRPTIGVRWSDISIWRRSGFSAVVKCICIVLLAGTTATYEAQNLDYRLLQPQMILIRWGDRVCSFNQIKPQIFYCDPTSILLHDKLLY